MRTIYTPSIITKEELAALWQDSTIVFDTCALLDLHYLTLDIQDVVKDILQLLADRIWIPAQVLDEYERNYPEIFGKVFSERYNDKDVQKDKLIDSIQQLIKQNDREYYHPYMDSEEIARLKSIVAEIKPKIDEAKKMIAIQYQKRHKEILDSKIKNVLHDEIKDLAVGTPFTFAEIKRIMVEGNVRFVNQTPPGYKDRETKRGMRQYGDLIIWKEILRFAKVNNRDILFVTNDIKEDWVFTDNMKQDKMSVKPLKQEIGNPRRELLCEFEEETGRRIWIIQTAQFISLLEEQYKSNQGTIQFYGKLGIVRDVLAKQEFDRKMERQHKNGYLLLKCNHCKKLSDFDADDFFYNWEGGVVDERGMGPESEYISEECCECKHCGQQFGTRFHVWEYPMGAFNYQDIEVEGATVEEPFDLSHYISFGDYECCYRCGERALLNGIGLCDQCQQEFDDFVKSDD